MYLDAF